MTGLRRLGLHSTPLRLAGVLILVFSVAILAGHGAAYLVLRDRLGRGIEQDVLQAVAAYAGMNSQSELEERLTEDVSILDPHRMVLLYTAADGHQIGNAANFPEVTDLTLLDIGTLLQAGASLPPGARFPDGGYLAYATPVGEGRLLVARGREQIGQLAQIFTTVLLISFLPTLVLASVIGFAVARRARARVEAIRCTLAALTAGNLSARVQCDGRGPDDLDQIGMEVNNMAGALTASIASLKQVSADIAHDLKTPIQRVSVLLDRMDRSGELDGEVQELMEQARAETGQIVKTFQALLQIAQIEGGGPRGRFAPVDLAEVARGMVEFYDPAAEAGGHRLDARCTGKAAAVLGDRALLGRIVANLIENALRHTPPGSRVAVAVTREAGAVVLRVTDDGPGIPEAERGNVLRRLYRLERSRTSEGSGLGLSLVAAIAELHGADLTLSDAGPGLVVRLAFPPA